MEDMEKDLHQIVSRKWLEEGEEDDVWKEYLWIVVAVNISLQHTLKIQEIFKSVIERSKKLLLFPISFSMVNYFWVYYILLMESSR